MEHKSKNQIVSLEVVEFKGNSWVKATFNGKSGITEPVRIFRRTITKLEALHAVFEQLGFDVSIDYSVQSADELPKDIPHYRY